jgi:UDP-glucuronate decarboxylase
MHILLTGGTGFFGKAFLRYWSSIFSNVVPIFELTIISRNALIFKENNPEYANLTWVNFINADILEPHSLKKHAGFTHIIHAAADSTNGYNVEPIYRFEQISLGTKNILEFAINRNIKTILQVSSGAVYGKQPSSMSKISENFNGSPDSLEVNSIYGLSKRIAENICCVYSHKYGVNVVIARCFSFGGKDLPLDKHYALGNFIQDIKKHDEIVINGTGEAIRSYLHQNDLAEWLYQLLIKGKNRNAYNVGSKQKIKIKELAEKILVISKSNKKINILGKNYRETNDLYLPDIEKIENEVGLKEKYTIDEIILDMLK